MDRVVPLRDALPAHLGGTGDGTAATWKGTSHRWASSTCANVTLGPSWLPDVWSSGLVAPGAGTAPLPPGLPPLGPIIDGDRLRYWAAAQRTLLRDLQLARSLYERQADRA